MIAVFSRKIEDGETPDPGAASAEAADVVLVLEERALRPGVDRSGHGELMGPMGDTHDIY